MVLLFDGKLFKWPTWARRFKVARKLSRKKKMVFSAITISILFAVLNFAAYIISPKDSVFWENPLMAMYPVEEFDQNITLEQVNRNDEVTRVVKYVPHPGRWYRLDPEPEIPDDGQLFLHFGDSSTFGWGLQDRSYAYPGVIGGIRQDVHSVNLGVPGYSSFQGLSYMREVLPGCHDRVLAVTLYFGNNDCTENGAPDADKRWERGSFLRRLPLVRLMQDAVVSSKSSDNNRPRVNPDEYERNMAEMIRLAQSYGIRVVVIAPPVPLTWRPGHLTPTVSLAGYVQNSWTSQELTISSAHYARGVSLLKSYDDQCEEVLSDAVNHDWVLPRIKPDWTDRLHAVARQYGVRIVDIPRPFILAEYPYTFVDYCHPSNGLHNKIGKRVVEVLGEER